MNPRAQSASDVKNTDKSVKVIQKLPHCLCFLFFFYLKNTLKSNKSTENRWKFELQYSIYNMILLIKPTFSDISNILSRLSSSGVNIYMTGGSEVYYLLTREEMAAEAQTLSRQY